MGGAFYTFALRSNNAPQQQIKTYMETTNKEVIEKKTYVDDHSRRNSGFGMGLAGVITGGLALANQLGGGRGLFGIGSGASTPDIVNNNTNTNTASASEAPTAFQAWEKVSTEALVLTNEIWGSKVDTLKEMYAHRQTDVSEKFGLYKATRDLYDVMNDKVSAAAFENYKYSRDSFDAVMARISALEKEVAVNSAVRPYQDKLIQGEIATALTTAINYADKLDCRNIKGVVTLPSTPTITGFQSQRCGCAAQGQAQG